MRLCKAVANWILGPIIEYNNKNGFSGKTKVFPDIGKLIDLAKIVEFTDLLDFSRAKTTVFPFIMEKTNNESVWEIMERLKLLERNTDDEVEKIIDEVLAKYPDKIKEYKNGKDGLLSFFVGETIKIVKGKFKAQYISETIKNKLTH